MPVGCRPERTIRNKSLCQGFLILAVFLSYETHVMERWHSVFVIHYHTDNTAFCATLVVVNVRGPSVSLSPARTCGGWFGAVSSLSAVSIPREGGRSCVVGYVGWEGGIERYSCYPDRQVRARWDLGRPSSERLATFLRAWFYINYRKSARI